MGENQFQPKLQTPENKVSYQSILDEIRNIYKNFILDSEDMRKVFDKKYPHDRVIQLLNEKGEPISYESENGKKRIEPIEFEKIDNHAKETHMRGLLYTLTTNPIDFIRKLSQEKELLDALSEKGNNLKELIEKYIQEENNAK